MVFLWFLSFRALISLSITSAVMSGSEIIFLEIPIMNLLNWSINFVFFIDQIRTLFIFSVSLIRFRVLIFSKRYIINDKNFTRFHFLLIAFILRIYFLILSPNIVRVLLGWDGLGLRSYLLVIYYGRSKAYNSGIITALTNRLGDSLILLRIGYLITVGNWRIFCYSTKSLDLILLTILIVAASTKRAQIPFSAWLPAAIAAPTPVSSLVHSSTLVTAGVYLLIRHENLFLNNRFTFYIITIGTITIILARIRALIETDLKKIVALSTLSQLGIMFLRLGVGRYILRFFHLLTHAFFKALLFLATGAIIHRRKDYQDLRLTGGRVNRLPSINRFILISRFRLIGLPFISAFFSKEIILETIILKNFNFAIYMIIILGVILTRIYRSRFIFLVFSNWTINDLLTLKLEEDSFVLRRMFILFFPASLAGSWIYLFLLRRLKLSTSSIWVKRLILMLILLGILVTVNFKLNYQKWNSIFWRLSRIWFLPLIRSQVINFITFNQRKQVFKLVDRGRLRFKVKYISLFLERTINTIRIKFISKILFFSLIWLIVLFRFYLCKIHYIKATRTRAKTRFWSKI